LEIRNIIKLTVPFILLFFSSCYIENKPVDNQPDNLFSKDKMTEVMTDIQIIEGALNFDKLKRKSIKELKEPYYNQLFIEHKISAKDFKQNLAYYNMRPEIMEEILEQVLENTNQILGKLEQRITKEKIADSLRKIEMQKDSLIRLSDSLNTNK